MYNTAMDHRYVQFGCGMCAPETWQNFDAGPAFWLQSRLPFLTPLLVKKGFPPYPKNIEYGDVIKGLPVPPGSAEAVYCSHVLEHMTLDEFRVAIKNVFSYLRPGGTFRLVLPDLEQLIGLYTGDPTPAACSRFMQESWLGEMTTPLVSIACTPRKKGLPPLSGLKRWRTRLPLERFPRRRLQAPLNIYIF